MPFKTIHRLLTLLIAFGFLLGSFGPFGAGVQAALSPASEPAAPAPVPPGDGPVLRSPFVSDPVAPADTTGMAVPDRPQVETGPAGETLGHATDPRLVLPLEPALADPVWQDTFGPGQMPAPVVNFEGLNNINGVLPPDTDGQVGPNHYVQMVNLSTAVYSKNGTLLYGPFTPNTLWPAGDPCRTTNDGDPVVLYDQMADRWLLTQFGLPNYPNGPFYECIAVSKGPVPTSNPADWYPYTFLVSQTQMNDYPKLGVWPDGYYMTANQFFAGITPTSVGVWVFDRAKMLNGQAAAFQYFDLLGFSDTWSLLPSNLMGSALPPAGAPNYMASVDQNWSGTDDVFHIYAFDVDWNAPANTSFSLVKDLVVAPFDATFDGGRSNIPQPGTTVGLDAIEGRLMMHLWYRNLGSHAALVVNHTVDVDGTDHAGIRWYEVRNPGPGAFIYQQGTFAPDQHHRWMGSIAMDKVGNLALGYSVSSSSVYPGIRYTGREAGDPLGVMTQGEATVINGSGSQTHSASRWGDYSAMSVDPVDDCTFWYTTEYIQTTGSAPWQTRIAAFKFPSCEAASGSLEGTVADSLANPVQGAKVTVANVTRSYVGYSQSDGTYGFSYILPDTYDVTVSAYGYLDTQVNDLVIDGAGPVVQDFTLTPAPSHRVSGSVADANTGWPLYAALEIEGYPFGPVWTDPATGAYSVTLVANQVYTFTVDAWTGGYLPQTLVVGPLVSDQTADFQLAPDLGTCSAPGYAPSGYAYDQDFEASDGGYTHSGFGDEWAWGTPAVWPDRCASGSKCWGTDLNGNYGTDVSQTLTSPVIDLSGYTPGAVLGARWQQALAIEAAIYDHARAEVRINGGAWQTMWEHFAGTTQADWTARSFDISAAAGSSVQFRWYLDSDAGVEFPGYYIDDVQITVGCDPQAGGLVVGSVSDQFGAGLTGATVSNDAGGSTLAKTTPTDPAQSDAFYLLFTPSGSHDLTAGGLLGYGLDTQTVAVPLNGTVRQDFVLGPAQEYTLEGVVSDASTGWPLYARVVVDGPDLRTFWTDPVTGYYSATVTEGYAYQVRSVAWVGGYTVGVFDLGTIGGNVVQDIGLNANLTTCTAPGYVLAGTCQPPLSGGLVVGNVYDANTALAVTGALVENDSGYSTLSAATVDPNVDEGFYTLFSPPGAHTVTATMSAYTPVAPIVVVSDGGTVRQDFDLPAGKLSVSPLNLSTPLEIGSQVTLTFTLDNQGSAAAAFSISELAALAVPEGLFEAPNYVVKPFKQDYRSSAPADVLPFEPAPAISGAGVIVRQWDSGLAKAWGVGYDPHRGSVLVSSPHANWGGVDLAFTFTADGAATGQALPHTLPHLNGPADLAYNGRTGTFWVLNVNSLDANCIYELNPASGGYTGRRICPGGSSGLENSARGLAYDPASDTYFAGGWNDAMIYRFRPDGTLVSRVYTGLPVSGLAYNPATRRLYAMLSADPAVVFVLDEAQDYAVVGQFAVEGLTPFGGAGLDIGCDGLLWAVDQNTGRVYQVETGEPGAFCATDFPWLAVEPASGLVAALDSQVVQVRLDGTQVLSPGQLQADLRIDTDTPYGALSVPLTVDVTAPAGWGLLQGTVTGLGACDSSPAALSGAEVVITDSLGISRTVTADASGGYFLWGPAGEYTVSVSHAGHLDAAPAAATVTEGGTAQVDFDLRALLPCVSVSPSVLNPVLHPGEILTVTLTIYNSGAAPADFNLALAPAAQAEPADWISFEPAAGVVPAGGVVLVQVVFDAAQLEIGTYPAAFLLATSDALHAEINIAVDAVVQNWLVYLPAITKP